MKEYIIAGIDLGTQSLKAVLYDCNQKRIAAQSSCALDLISEDDGTREQKTQWYDEALKSFRANCASAYKPSVCRGNSTVLFPSIKTDKRFTT